MPDVIKCALIPSTYQTPARWKLGQLINLILERSGEAPDAHSIASHEAGRS